MTQPIFEALWEHQVRIEAMWPFPTCTTPDDLANLFEDIDGEELLAPISNLLKLLDEDSREALADGHGFDRLMALEELNASAWRAGIHGWIAVAATPVLTPTTTGGCSFSWGHYYTKILWAETADQILLDAAAWGEANFDKVLNAEGGAK